MLLDELRRAKAAAEDEFAALVRAEGEEDRARHRGADADYVAPLPVELRSLARSLALRVGACVHTTVTRRNRD